jgi:CP family cyanate transporter-like MFS transporter
MLVPWLAARMSSQRPMVAAFVACYVVAYTGMLIAPRAGVWLWAFLAGVGAGAFPLALTMIGLRSRTADTTADLSAFTQSGGYLLAGVGPLLVGVLHGMTGGWTWPFVLLFADLTLLAVTGWYAAQPRFVEDDLA